MMLIKRAAAVLAMLLIAASAIAQTRPATTDPTLHGLVFLADAGAVRPGGWPAPAASAAAIDVSRVPLLADGRIVPGLARFIGHPFNIVVLQAVTDWVVAYCRRVGRPFVRVVVPKQDATSGVVQVLVIEAHVGKLTISGNRWFPDREFRDVIALHPGDVLEARRLDAAVDALNANPYRHVRPVMNAGATLGTTDVTLQVQDRLPLSPSFSIGNSGNATTGETQLTGGLDWGDALWRGDDLNVQYTTGTNLSGLHQYSAGYTASLPWGDRITIDGSGARTAPVSPPAAVAVGSIGTMANVSPRYVHAFGASQLSAGFDWKRSNNDLLFGGESIFSSSTTVEQFTVAYSRSFSDRHGSTSAGATVIYSPGGLSAGNSDAAFDAQREGAPARYAYVRLNAERATRLARGFVWDVRANGQIADAPLLSSEQLAFGGDGSIRGVETFAATRDSGVIVNMELQAPALHPNLPRHLSLGADATDGLNLFAFVDYGAGTLRDAADVPLLQLTTAGPGVRYQYARYASVSLSYGFIVQHAGFETTSMGRVQFQVNATY